MALGLFLIIGTLVNVLLILNSIFNKQKDKDVSNIENKKQGEIPKPTMVKKGIEAIQKEDVPIFTIEEQSTIPKLPDIKNSNQTDIKYPLIPPYAYAHIKWDPENTELVYLIEEPELSSNEKEVLKTLEDGIRELINLSFISVKDKNTVIIYLEKNIKVLLTELNINLNTDSFKKIMYYIYRDFVGLNEIEPLMNDYFIEDIECNGLNSPVYLVHRKYRNIRTNLIYNDIHKMAAFVEKLAQKCGRYVSYAEPLLDGSLPSGDRVNATYSIDVSSKGPTFTIRRFFSEPWSPIQLMIKGTTNAEILAYIWMMCEYEKSFMVIGGTGSGKCVTGDTPIYLADGRIVNIKELVEDKIKFGKIKTNEDWEYIDGDGTGVLCMHKDELKIIKTKIDKFWRHKAPEKLIRIKTRSGRTITTTPEHPFFTIKDGELIKIRADLINKGTNIAVPREVPLNLSKSKVNFLDYLKDSNDLFVADEFVNVKSAIKIIKENNNFDYNELGKSINVNPRTISSWTWENAIPIKYYCKFLNDAGININKNLKIKAKTSPYSIIIPNIGAELYKFAAYVIGDGHLTKTNIQFHNSNKKLRDEFIKLGKELFNIGGVEEFPKNRTPKIVFYSKPISMILNKVFEIPYGNKARKVKVPESLYMQDNDCISQFIKAISDCESHVSKTQIEICTTSKELAVGINRLLIRLGVLPYLITRKNHFRIYISGINNLTNYYNSVGYSHPEKVSKLHKIITRHISRITSNVDLVPNTSKLISYARNNLGMTKKELALNVGVSRRFIGMLESSFRFPSIHTFKDFNDYIVETSLPETFKSRVKALANSDVFWDEIKEVEELTEHNEEYVYDLTVNEHHNFLAGDIPIVIHNTSFLNVCAFFIPPQSRVVSIEDTRELKLEHENWLPSVARGGVGLTNLLGQRYGEVSLFDLLKASFRQRPDYIIVGEVRGKEAFVLFQAMASGHPGMATMHAENVPTMIKRLETNPINLSGSLIETLSSVIVMSQTKVRGKEARKVARIDEIIKMKEGLGGEVLNNIFKWDPRTDKFTFNSRSKVFNDIAVQYGYTSQQIMNEFKIRIKLLKELYNRRIMGFKEVQHIIHEYYKSPRVILRRFDLIK